jgi:hypothetical protein
VSTVRTRNQGNWKLAVESAALGLGYAAGLVWVGSALVGSFGYDDAYPYWPAIPQLRTDTAGFLAFAVAIVGLVVSKYLQLRRRNGAPAPTVAVPRAAGVHAVQAVAETAAVLGTGLVIYLSFNAVMHPWTLRIQLTHLLPWPSEGTVRVIALAICLVAVAVSRYLRATAVRPAQAAELQGAGRQGAQGAERQGLQAAEWQGIQAAERQNIQGAGWPGLRGAERQDVQGAAGPSTAGSGFRRPYLGLALLPRARRPGTVATWRFGS